MTKKKTRKTVTKSSAPKVTAAATAAISPETLAKVNSLCDKQDSALIQILSVARLAKHALYVEADLATNEVAEDVGQTLALIVKLAAASIQSLDTDLASIEETRLRPAA